MITYCALLAPRMGFELFGCEFCCGGPTQERHAKKEEQRRPTPEVEGFNLRK